MSKSGLGRGLGDLMSKAVSPKTIAEAEPQESGAPAGPGVRSLLKGSRPDAFSGIEDSAPAPATLTPPEKSEVPFPLWYLFAGDVVLLLFACLLIFKDQASLDWTRIAIASVATILGAALAAAGVLLAEKKS